MIFGPNGPNTIRNLKDTLAGMSSRPAPSGATLIFPPPHPISPCLPVYEIYKVGQDVHAVDGLNLFADFGLHVSFIPHWNNTDGGVDLDTSRFIGMDAQRMEQFRAIQ
jgi:hypothetical protein